jgi:carboxymethylenebutenolidase
MLAAVARPAGAGPFPTVLVLHGTHGFARQYVDWAVALARGGFLAVAACWFSGGGGPTLHEVTPIPCPDLPPLGPGEYPEGLQYVDALVQATRTLPDARPERLALAGHSRGGGATLQYLLAKGQAQAAILHSSGYALRPETRAAEFNAPILIMHGTADSAATGGSANTETERARVFEAALRRNQQSVEASYYEGGGHGTFFTNATQREDELKTMTAFLRRHLVR